MEDVLALGLRPMITGQVKVVDAYHKRYGQVGRIDDRHAFTTDPKTGERSYVVIFSPQGAQFGDADTFMGPQLEKVG